MFLNYLLGVALFFAFLANFAFRKIFKSLSWVDKPDGIKKLEDLGATEVIVAFRNAYEGGADERTLDGMIAEINWYAEEVINKSK